MMVKSQFQFPGQAKPQHARLVHVQADALLLLHCRHGGGHRPPRHLRPLAAQLLSGETPIPPGATGPIDLHKSLVDKMSLLSISQETEGSEGSTTPTWILVIILCGLSVIFAIAYLYHQKVRLPRRRSAREEERIERERNARNMAFLERLMQNEGNPPPA